METVPEILVKVSPFTYKTGQKYQSLLPMANKLFHVSFVFLAS